MGRILSLLLYLCGFLVASDYQSNSKIYQQWFKDIQENYQLKICNNSQSEECQEIIKESCESYDQKDYEWCKNKIISINTDTYRKFIILNHYTPMTIRKMIENEDINGLVTIIKIMPNVIGENIASLESHCGINFILETFCYDNISPKSLEVLFKYGNLKPSQCKGSPPLVYTTQKLHEAESKGDSKAVENYQKIIEILQKYKAQ